MTPLHYKPYLAIATLLLFAGCSHRVPEATIEVIDTSLSITPRAEKAALDSVQGQISLMQRGDMLILIPITGNATNDSMGRVLRLSAPTRRETYDTDLHRFQEQARIQFAAWVASLDKHQSRTDIFGALDAVRQELALLPKDTNRKLIVVSDFLVDDGAYRFVSDGSLTSPVRARKLAMHIRERQGFSLRGATLCLGRLESSEFAPLSAERKEAIRDFWTTYFAEGNQAPEIQFDGAGMLARADHGCFSE